MLPLVPLLLLLATPARAEPAYARFATWLRAGPAQSAPITDELRAGQALDRAACEAGWCSVRAGRAQGYVAEAMLAPGAPPARVPAAQGCFPASHATPAGPIPLQLCPEAPAPTRP